MDAPKLVLSLTAEGLDAYCRELIRLAPNGGHALAGLVALQSFVTEMAEPGSCINPAYKAAQSVIETHVATTRQRLLNESADGLARAMREADLQAVANIHASLSRNGFWQAAQQAIQKLDENELAAAVAWAKSWCREAKQRAEAASGYPDALDFKKAGIVPEEYTALVELARYLESAS